jgi:hypothetical protein
VLLARVERAAHGLGILKVQKSNPLISGLISRKYLKTNKKSIISIAVYSICFPSLLIILSQFYHSDNGSTIPMVKTSVGIEVAFCLLHKQID